jgi:hypothetical protein
MDENKTMNCLPEFWTTEIMPRQHFLTLVSWSLWSRLSCRVARHRSVVTDPIRLLLVGYLCICSSVTSTYRHLPSNNKALESNLPVDWLILFSEVWIGTAVGVMPKKKLFSIMARILSFVVIYLTWSHHFRLLSFLKFKLIMHYVCVHIQFDSVNRFSADMICYTYGRHSTVEL